MNELKEYTEKTFDNIKHIDNNGNEYWLARELQKVLEYKDWRKFKGVIDKAKIACELGSYKTLEHFVGTDKTSNMPNGGIKIIADYKLSRYACYLIAQGGEERTKYGDGLIKEYSKKLSEELGEKYNITTLKRMRQFYLIIEKGATLWHQLTWSHYKKFLSLKDVNEIEYYFQMITTI